MRLRLIAAAAVVSAIVGAVAAVAAVELWPDDSGDAQPAAAVSTPAKPAASSPDNSPSDGQASLSSSCLSAADIYTRVRPAVVQITSTAGGRNPFAPPSEATGSGILIDDQGHILTNYHVVAGADNLEVRFADGATAQARLVGTDPGNDLAVISVDVPPSGPAPAPLGDADALRVGDTVLAIGNPFNLEGTLTQGIVSAVGRTYAPAGGTRPIRAMIQTDAPVNPGNSGGPLLSCRGEVIGVNTLLENPTGDSVNVGVAFAVPVNTVKRFLPDMLAGKTVQHPWLGIAGQEVTPALAKDLGLPVDSGVYVTLVAGGGPAERSGLRAAFGSEAQAVGSSAVPQGGDVITAVDGQDVATVEDLADYLDTRKHVGETVRLAVSRNGDRSEMEATLGEWPS